MTILVRLERPGLELTVCGMVSQQWLDGLVREAGGIADGQGGLTQGQWAWRDVHLQAMENATAEPPPRVSARPARRRRAGRSTPDRFDLVDTEEL